MNPARSPIGRELFAQWQRARGARTGQAARPFTRGWEELLEDARLTSAAERNEAEADARSLAKDGMLELKPVRYRPHWIARVAIPLAAEAGWGESFGFRPPTDEEARRIREFPWAPALAFLREARVNLSFEELRRLNEFLKQDGDRDVVPIKERSLEIFGDEKRLDALVNSALFRNGPLNLTRLHCDVVPEPLGWKRGPAAAADRPVIVLENAATWHSYARWNEATAQFSAVIYGGGNRFVDGVGFLGQIFHELGGTRPVFYFGDLDLAGLAIPQRACRRAQELGLPALQPHLWSYRQLLTFSREAVPIAEGGQQAGELCDWLGELAAAAQQLIADGRRLAQEHVGWEFLRTQIRD